MKIVSLGKHRRLGRMLGSVTDTTRCREERPGFRALLFLMAMTLLPLLQGCVTPERLSAVPENQQAAAIVDGMPGVRYWQKADLELMEQDGIDPAIAAQADGDA